MNKKYELFEHTPMGDRKTYIEFTKENDQVSGTASVDAGPYERVKVKMSECIFTDELFSFLIVLGDLPRRYSGKITGNSLKGEVVFEGTGELAGIRTPFDGNGI